jgi:hypothetical protein
MYFFQMRQEREEERLEGECLLLYKKVASTLQVAERYY